MARSLHIHVEEPSMEAFLEDFIPRRLAVDFDWKIINHNSKWQLLERLPARLRGYASISKEYRPKSLVLIDRDEDDCVALKARLEQACAAAGLVSKSAGGGAAPDVVNRIVIEELEAWYFGDATAVAAGWPGVSPNLARRARFRDPDAIKGGTHEAFLQVLQKAGYLRDAARLPKIDAARRMAGLVDPARNTSKSFGHFMTGLEVLIQTG